MKMFFTFCAALIMTVAPMAQPTKGAVRFEQKIDVHRRLPPDDEQMRAMVPRFQTVEKELIFDENRSFYHEIESEEDDADMSGDKGGAVVKIKFGSPDDAVFIDFPAKKKVEQKEFMGKNYLLKDDLAAKAWKIAANETKDVLGFACMKAAWADTARKRDYVAWFCPKFKPSSGPEAFIGLPGMVLSVEMNAGEIIWNAIAIDDKWPKKFKFEPPTKGAETTEAAFRKMVDDEMRKQGGGGIMIKTEDKRN